MFHFLSKFYFVFVIQWQVVWETQLFCIYLVFDKCNSCYATVEYTSFCLYDTISFAIRCRLIGIPFVIFSQTTINQLHQIDRTRQILQITCHLFITITTTITISLLFYKRYLRSNQTNNNIFYPQRKF